MGNELYSKFYMNIMEELNEIKKMLFMLLNDEQKQKIHDDLIKKYSDKVKSAKQELARLEQGSEKNE